MLADCDLYSRQAGQADPSRVWYLASRTSLNIRYIEADTGRTLQRILPDGNIREWSTSSSTPSGTSQTPFPPHRQRCAYSTSVRSSDG